MKNGLSVSTATTAYAPVYTMTMANLQVFDDSTQLAKAAAKLTIDILKETIDDYDRAVWVLAGGTSPLLVYKTIVANYRNAVNWTKVTVVIGDERIGPLDGLDNSWQAIDAIIGGLPITKLRPMSDLSAEEAAEDYSQQLMNLPKADSGLPRFDLIWLGLGQDGHTLSLFPRHESLLPSNGVVIPVHHSPKPPKDRISLSLRALQGAQNAIIIASGADKKDAVTKAQKSSNLPIALAASIIETHDGNITWLVDKSAAPTD